MIEVNGKSVEYTSGLTVAALLEQLGFVFPMLVIKVNGKLIKRESYEQTPIQDGDRVQVIHLISGG